MAGSTGFTRDTLDSLDMRDPKLGMQQVKDLEDVSKNIQKNITGGPAVGLDLFQRQGAQNKMLTAEQERRKAAVPGVFDVAGAIDQRLTAAGDTLAEAENKQGNKVSDLYQQQAQALQEADYNKRKGLSDIDYKRKDIDWELEKNQTRRDDALEDAYVKGTMDDVILELGISNKMKLMDLDHYFRLKQNNLDQGMKDWTTMSDIEWSKFLAEMTASAQAFAALFEGFTGALAAVAKG
jgi:hypothetical protein